MAERLNPDNWQVGDLAECIVSVVWCNNRGDVLHHGPEVGDVFTVAHVMVYPGFEFLRFRVFPGDAAFQSNGFRKIEPVHDDALVSRIKGAPVS